MLFVFLECDAGCLILLNATDMLMDRTIMAVFAIV